jgi:hypothetical protein
MNGQRVDDCAFAPRFALCTPRPSVTLRNATLLAFALAACTAGREETPPKPAPKKAAKAVEAPVRIDRERYVFRYGFFGPEITIVSTFRAPKERPVYIVNCNGAMSYGLQRLVDGKWIESWGAVTNSCLSEPIVIAAGGERSETIILRPGVGAVIYPREDRKVIEAGTYRVVWHGVLFSFDFNARPFGDALPVEQRASAPFVVEAAPPQPAAIVSIAPLEDVYVPADTPLRVVFERPRLPIRVYVDGKDVTSQTVGVGTDDVPLSRIELTFAPPGGWIPGWRGVKVELGDGSVYSWAFIAEAPSS